MPERNVEEQEPGAGEVEDQLQCGWRVVQSQGPAGLGGLLRGVEEDVEAGAVAEGNGGEVDVDGADAVAQTSRQCRAYQRGRFQVDLTGQGDQYLLPRSWR